MANLRSKGPSSKYRPLLLGLGLLNVALLISAIVMAVYCAKLKEESFHITHPVALELTNKLSDFRNNHSNVIMAEEDANLELQTALNEYSKLQAQLEQQTSLNDDSQKRLVSLRTERSNLQSNISALEGSCGICPAGFIHFNHSCYFFSSSKVSSIKKNWHNSRSDCISRGSDLIVIDSPEEQIFVSKKIKTLVKEWNWENGFWVGLTDIETEERWVWINNATELEKRYWADGEPNNHGPEGEDCVVVIYSSSLPWHTRFDAKCKDHELNWLCEKVAE